MANSVNHDLLFKWLISNFLTDFFAHYFPEIALQNYRMADKEFYQAYQNNSGGKSCDLLILVEVQVDDEYQEVIIIIEHKSWREDVRSQIMSYWCYAWLWREKPVWPIVVFTGRERWRKEYDNQIWFGMSAAGKQYLKCDIIKVNREKSKSLLARESLFCKLLALEANLTGCKREQIVHAIYETVKEQQDQLNESTLALTEQFVLAYGQLPEGKVAEIKKELNLNIAAATILEHYEEIGLEKGKEIGIEIGLIKGEIRIIQKLFAQGLISQEVYDTLITPLEKEREEPKQQPK